MAHPVNSGSTGSFRNVKNSVKAELYDDGQLTIFCNSCGMTHIASLLERHAVEAWRGFNQRHRRYHPEWYLNIDQFYTFDNPRPDFPHKREDVGLDEWWAGEIAIRCACGFYEQTTNSGVGLRYLDREWDMWHDQYQQQADQGR